MPLLPLTAVLVTLALTGCGDPACPEGSARDGTRCVAIDAGPTDSGTDGA